MNQDKSSNLYITYFSITILFVIIIDQFLKNFFSDNLSLGESIPIIHNVVHITLVHNTGIAFGLFQGQNLVFVIVSISATLLLGYNVYRYKHKNHRLSYFYMTAFALILGGAISNLLNRITRGYVIDFIDFRVWPVFNLADSAITIGAVLILIDVIRKESCKQPG